MSRTGTPRGGETQSTSAEHLVDLAAEPDDDHAGDVGMTRVAGERAAQHGQSLALDASPQPPRWVTAITPSTSGYSSSAPGAENDDTMRRTTVAEQFTELTTAT